MNVSPNPIVVHPGDTIPITMVSPPVGTNHYSVAFVAGSEGHEEWFTPETIHFSGPAFAFTVAKRAAESNHIWNLLFTAYNDSEIVLDTVTIPLVLN